MKPKRRSNPESMAAAIERAWVPDGWTPRLWALRCRYMAEQCRDAERAAEWAALAAAVRERYLPRVIKESEYERIAQAVFFPGG